MENNTPSYKQRLQSFYDDVIMDVVHHYFESKILGNKSFQSFLEENLHILFHKWEPRKRCCECSKTLPTDLSTGKLEKIQFDLLYVCDDQNPATKEHTHADKSKECLQRYTPNMATVSEGVVTMDICLICILIKSCCLPGTFPGDPSVLEDIKHCRHFISHLGTQFSENVQPKLEENWKLLESSVLDIAKTLGKAYEHGLKRRISSFASKNALIKDFSCSVAEEFVRAFIGHKENVDNINFKFVSTEFRTNPPQAGTDKEQVEGARKYRVHWKFENPPGQWEIQRMTEKLNCLPVISDFVVECVYVGSLVVVTTTTFSILQNTKTYQAIIKDFLTQFVKVTELDSSKKTIVDVVVKIDLATTESSVREKEQRVELDTKLETETEYASAQVPLDLAGQTPLQYAVKNNDKAMVSRLLIDGAETDVADENGDTPLHQAVKKNNEPIVSLLLTHGSLVNKKNNEGDAPLHYAAEYGSRSLNVALLKCGAIIMDKNIEGKTAMDLARKLNNQAVSKLFKNILSSGLPKELLYLSTDDSTTFASNLRSGFYLSFVGNIMCVGNHAVGKTAITSGLSAKKSIKVRSSTEELDLHIYRAAVDMDMKKWVMQELDVEDVAFRDLLYEPKIAVQTLDLISEKDNEYDQDDDKNDGNGACSDLPNTEQNKEPLQDTRSGNQEDSTNLSNTQNRKSFIQRLKHRLGLEKAKLDTVEDIQQEAVRRGKKGLISSSLAPISMMDWGGQTALFSFQQSFFAYRGIYLLVIDGSKGLDDVLETELFIPGLYGKLTSRKTTRFWVGLLESYSRGGQDIFPKILIVCTHKDKVSKDEADGRSNHIFTEIEKMFTDTTAMKHLVLEPRIFINAMDPLDPGYDMLKHVLFKLLCSQPSWGEKVPKAWIHLKMMIKRSVEEGVPIMSINTLRNINKDNPVQVLSEKDLQLFLKLNNSQGEIIHFPLPGLQNNIIISPKFIVDALRSLSTDKRFRKDQSLKTLKLVDNQDGLLQHKDIETLWKGNTKFLPHKEYIITLMIHLDILIPARNYDESGTNVRPDFYVVPFLLKKTGDTQYFEEACNSKPLGCSFKFHSDILPPAVGYILIASCIDIFEMKRFKGQIMLFSEMVVFSVKKNLDLAVILRFDRVDAFLIHHTSMFGIVRDTAFGVVECLKDIMMNVLKNKKMISSEDTTMPFNTEFMCSNMLSPCYNEGKENWTCVHENKVESSQEIRNKWTVDRAMGTCKADCKGLISTDLNEKPSEIQLAKLVLQFTWEELLQLLTALGLESTEIEYITIDHGFNLLNVAFLSLRKWKVRTNGNVGDLIKAIEDMELDIHAACKMVRDKPMCIPEDVLKTEPTDKLIDSISCEVISESLFLSIHLGHNAALWLGMKDEKNKIVNINRNLLQRWKSEHPKKDQMRELAQALCNVGLNITSFDI